MRLAIRYVWEKRNPPHKYVDNSVLTTGEVSVSTSYNTSICKVDKICPKYLNSFNSFYRSFNTIEETLGTVRSSPYSSNSITVSLEPGYYMLYNSNLTESSRTLWTFRVVSTTSFYLKYNRDEQSEGSYPVTYYYFGYSFTGGTVYDLKSTTDNALIATISTTSSSTYDTTQLVDGYRYIYKGTDTIDPAAVSSPADPRGG